MLANEAISTCLRALGDVGLLFGAIVKLDDFARKPARENPVQEYKRLVLNSGDGGDFSISKSAVTALRDRFGGHFGCFDLPNFLPARDAAKIAPGRAGKRHRRP